MGVFELKCAIVVIGYNRTKSLKRLLLSLSKAEYRDDIIDLIISIDNSGSDEVEKCASEYCWLFGEKKIITYKERLGLRNHVLKCGNILDDYDVIAVLEDDLIISPSFYLYMKSAYEYYKDDDNIAGISLYSYSINESNNLPFHAEYSKYDTFFIQFAPSWGQIWIKKQWKAFYEWYLSHNEEFGPSDRIPLNVSSWPASSWKKYHIKYCIEENKYFVYPYKSFSTCFSEAGAHTVEASLLLQTQLLYTIQDKYRFAPLNEDAIRYDAFFERVFSDSVLIGKIPVKDICIDLYGYGRHYFDRRYLLSSKIMEYEVICSFGAIVEPQEENVIQNSRGNVFHLYDTLKKSKKPHNNNFEYIYRFKVFSNRKKLLKNLICQMFK